ncbi:Type II secretion system protein D precursor [Thalassoglobus polymorphus]|uniref:Type II secretion system protein D n=2 Tax=Thalassoglobus polymorphus TaxID=2527994 RepID=A0A517QUT5_9PLAN|nr:Type II secretion system protein D precursor [Thalassoglobus polymorphus]
MDPQLTIDLQLDRPVVLRLKQALVRDQIANPEVLDALTLSETEFSLVGKQIGSTVLNLWFESEEHPGTLESLSYLVRVQDDPEEIDRYRELLSQLELEINRAFPNSALRLSYVGKQVVVRGQAKDVQEADSILQIVASSLPTQAAADLPPLVETETTAVSRVEREIPRYDQNIIAGQTPTNSAIQRQRNRIINLLEIGGIHQVMLKVAVAEVNRSAVRAIGADLRIGGSTSSFFSLLPLSGSGAAFLVNRGDFDLAINALKQLNLARSLAEPNLTTLNGQPANFQVGGEFPVPVVTGATDTGLQGVEFIPFGVQLSFTPTVTEGDRIRLNLQATVSTRTDDTTNIDGADISGLNSRNFQSTVELREGQTIAIAGLIQSNLGATSDRVPLLGDIPFVGRLFSSDRTSYDEQELIVLVTPYLVNPIDANREQLPLPGSDYFEPDDLEFFLRGSLTGHFAEDFRTPARTDIHQIKAFRRLEQELIIGQPGHSNGLLCPSVETKVHP